MIQLFKKHKEIIMYLIFGVATTVVNWIVYAVCTKAVGLSAEGVQGMLSNGIAWVIAVLFAFFTNKWFVFESKTETKGLMLQEMARFFGARVFSGIFEILLPPALIFVGINQAFFGIEGGIAKAITSVVVIVLNYVLSKLVVFRKKPEQK